MSTTGTSLRTIWIEIRAMNYAVNVLNDVLRQLNMVQMGQEATAISSLNMAKAALSAGVLFSVLGSQIGGTAGQFLQYASYAMYAVAAMQAVIAAMKVMNVETLYSAQLFLETWYPIIAPIAAFAAVFLALKGYLGTIPALLIAIAVAAGVLAVSLWLAGGGMAVLTGGVSADAALGPLAAAKALSTVSAFQMGTRMVSATGPALLHKGEVVYNPASGRPSQVNNDLTGGGGMIHNDNSMNIGTINTKMDTEELSNMVRKQQRTIAQNNR